MRTVLLCLAFFSLLSTKGVSQCSNPYFQLKSGTFMATENYDDKGKLLGRAESRVTELTETADGFDAIISYKVFDKKDKIISEGSYKCECSNGEIRIEMKAFVPQESMQAYKDMEVEIISEDLQLPAVLAVGQELPDANFQLKTTNSPVPMNMTFNMTDRKVEGKESITTPLGTFDCLKISSNTQSKMVMVNMNFKTIQYMAEKYGAVKTESYKSNGTLTGYTILTKFE